MFFSLSVTSALPLASHIASWQCAVNIWFWCMNSNLIWAISLSHSLAAFPLHLTCYVCFICIVYVMRWIWLFSVSNLNDNLFPRRLQMRMWAMYGIRRPVNNIIQISSFRSKHSRKKKELKQIEREIKWTSVYCVCCCCRRRRLPSQLFCSN